MSLQLNTKTKESTTADGTVEYDAVECTRCGFDTPTENATMVVLPTNANYRQRVHGANGMLISHASDAPAAALCDDCAESLFGKDLREHNYQKRLANWTQKRDRRFFIMAAIHLIGLVLAVAGLFCLALGP